MPPQQARGSEPEGIVRFSIITPTLNRAERLAQAIQSANHQSVAPFEHIIVDGGSTDGTHDLLASFPNLTLISGPDAGLYDAINKGIRLAQGEVIVLLNDDDLLLPNALGVARRALDNDPLADMFAGQVVVKQEGGHGPPVLIGSARLRELNPRAHAAGTNLFNARFFRRHVFDRVGTFDIRYLASADTEFLGRCFLAGVTVASVEEPVYQYTVHSGAITFHGEPLAEPLIAERIEIARDHLSAPIDRAAHSYWRRWLWWWTFYRAIRWGSLGRWAAFGRLVKEEPTGVADFVVQCGWHLTTRAERRGRPVRHDSDGQLASEDRPIANE